MTAPAVPTPVDDSMVPLEAPKQGVWFDRAPFDAATGRTDEEEDRSAQGPSRGAAGRQAHGIAESAEAETGAQLLSSFMHHVTIRELSLAPECTPS